MTLTNQLSLFSKFARQCKKGSKAYIDCMSRKLKNASKRGSFETKKKRVLTSTDTTVIRDVALLTPFTFFLGGGMMQLYQIMLGTQAEGLLGTIIMIMVGLIGLLVVYNFVMKGD